MSKATRFSTKRVIVKTENDEVWKIFESVIECADFFGKTKAIIYNRCNTPNHAYQDMGYKLKFSTEKKETVKKESGTSAAQETRLRAKETEDQTRRRLGLNPYGEWRNDEWINAMIERVDKMLYPDGYDHHAVWIAIKGKERADKGLAKEIGPNKEKEIEVDEEFKQYFK